MLYHFTITSALFRFAAAPRYTVLEGLVSVDILAALAAALALRERRGNRK